MKPMLAEAAHRGQRTSRASDWTVLEGYMENDDFYFEQKVDGVRLIVERAIAPGGGPAGVLGYNRKGENVAVPKHIAAVFNKLTKHVIVDGELVGDTYWMFDICGGLGINVHSRSDTHIGFATPMWTRRQTLDIFGAEVEKLEPRVRLLPVARTFTEKREMAVRLKKANVEGLMLKTREGSYLEGLRTQAVLKWKFWESIDCFVTEVGREGKRSVAVGVVSLLPSANIVDVGSVTVTDEWLAKLQVGDVIECKYLYAVSQSDPRLYQPSFLRLRTDKEMAECNIDQLKYTYKGVVE